MVHELFDHTLGVIRSWPRAMERTPRDYATAGEEKLRDALLILLNTHYEGAGFQGTSSICCCRVRKHLEP